MKKRKKSGRKLLSFLLTLAMLVGLMPGMGLTAYADDDPPYAQYKNTTTVITFDGKSWYLIDYDASTVTLLAKDCVASSQYNESGSFVEYINNPTVKTHRSRKRRPTAASPQTPRNRKVPTRRRSRTTRISYRLTMAGSWLAFLRTRA